MNPPLLRIPAAAAPMPFSGERYVSGVVGNVASGDIQSEHYHRYLFALEFCAGKDVLDVASGEGYGSACLGQVARSVLGIDSSREAVDFAHHHYADARVRFQHGLAQELPVETGSIDVVVSFETIEHFAEHEQFGREIVRVLRPDGLLVISSPNRTFYSEQPGYQNEFHLRELDRAGFVQFLEAFFPVHRMFAQRPLSGSVLLVDDCGDTAAPVGFLHRGGGLFERTIGAPRAPFLVAVAARGGLPLLASSVLHNPTLLESLDAARVEAVAEASARAAQAADLEGRVRELIEEARAREARLAEAMTPPASPRVERAADTRLTAMRQMAQARIALLRRELADSRARNGELVAELAAAHAVRSGLDHMVARYGALAREHARVQASAAELRDALGLITQSTSWRLTAPLRTAAATIPPGHRARLRRVAGRLGNAGTAAEATMPAAPETFTTDPAWEVPFAYAEPERVVEPVDSEEAQAAPPRPATPSERFRSADANWRLPRLRPEIIQLREHRPTARVAAVLHVFYPELWGELASALTNIVEPFDVFVTLVAGASGHLAPVVLEAFPRANVVVMDNHGRDILPFVELLNSGALFHYDCIVKIHTKRTTWRPGGDEWRQHLVAGVLDGPERTETIIRTFESDPDVGMILADGQRFSGREFWVSNEPIVQRLGARLGLGAEFPERSFAGGSIYWIRPFVLRPLAALGLSFDDFDCEPLASDGTMAHAVERVVSLLCHDAGMRIAEVRELGAAASPPIASDVRVHLVATYLPQFHPTAYNSRWWGPGFTEWTNVTRARPLFTDHRQPRLPADLGFYDLRLAETRGAQAALATRYGVSAFCYYYYWFDGEKLLDRPLADVAASGEPDFPFMICWANEPWTRRWDGLAREVLMPQSYSPGWEERLAADIAPLLRDRRYLHLDGRPLLALYRVRHIPDPAAALSRLRAALAALGVPAVMILGAAIQVGGDPPIPARPEELGLDAFFEFPPHGIAACPATLAEPLDPPELAERIYDYNATVEASLDRTTAQLGERRFRGVMAGWDNTARRGTDAHLFVGATPTNFRRWLRAVVRQAEAEAEGPETLVFINAWNEWAEGTYLEPDQDFGHGWLEAVASARGHRPAVAPEPPKP